MQAQLKVALQLILLGIIIFGGIRDGSAIFVPLIAGDRPLREERTNAHIVAKQHPVVLVDDDVVQLLTMDGIKADGIDGACTILPFTVRNADFLRLCLLENKRAFVNYPCEW